MTDDVAPPILQAIGLGRRSRTGDWLLRQATLTVRPGDRIALAGRSGSGKTLLMRAMARLDPIEEGEVRWRGKPIGGRRVAEFRSRVIYLPQRAHLVDGTVRENLELPFGLAAFKGRQFDRAFAIDALCRLGRQASFLEKRHSDLSGGETQIVALLRAVQLEPETLLLDEPTAALDQDAACAVEDLVGRWIEDAPEQRGLLWASHDVRQSARIANRRVEIVKGRLQSESVAP